MTTMMTHKWHKNGTYGTIGTLFPVKREFENPHTRTGKVVPFLPFLP